MLTVDEEGKMKEKKVTNLNQTTEQASQPPYTTRNQTK